MYLAIDDVERLYELLVAYDKIIIHRHVRPDPDALGSQLGLKALILGAFPDKEVLLGGTTSQGLAWMGEMDSLRPSDYDNSLVLVTDTANLERIDGEGYQRAKTWVKIDHHPPVEPYGDLQLVYPAASSTSEIVTAISYYLKDRLPMNDQAAELLYAGILGDTGRFMYSTYPLTFQMASFLITYDFDLRKVTDRFQVLTFNQAHFKAAAINKMVVRDSGMAYLMIRRSDLEEYGISEEETQIVVNVPGQIMGVNSWVIFIEQASGDLKWRTRLRSKGPVINELAAEFHGGGHPMASGAKAYTDEEMYTIIRKLDQIAWEYKHKRA